MIPEIRKMTGLKRKTRRAVTSDVLVGHFVGYDTKKRTYSICRDYLNESIILLLNNNQNLYEAMANTRRKPEGIVWEAFTKLTDDLINNDVREPGVVFYAASQHLKNFLFTYGEGYEEIAESIKHVRQVRKELKDLKKGEQRKINVET